MLRRFAIAASLLLTFVTQASAQIPFTRESMLTRTALGRLGLEKNWSTVVPLGGADDRVLDVSLSSGMLLAQTAGGIIHAYDAETGRYLWSTQLQRGMDVAFPASVTKNLVVITAGKNLHGLDRGTGRPVWKETLDGIAATGVVTDDEYAVVGEQNGKIVAYNLLDNSKKDPPGRSPGTFAWALQTLDTLTARPLLTPKVVAFGSHDKRVYTAVIPEPGNSKLEPLYRFLTDGPVNAPLVGFGNRTLIVPSEDKKLYAIDLFNGKSKWSVATGHPISHQPYVAGKEVYALNNVGRLIAIDGESGSILWDRPTEGIEIIAISPSRLYLMSEFRDLSILDRASGQMLASPRDSLERAGLNARLYTLNINNEENDRLYLASPNGLIYSLREIGHLQSAPLRDPNLPPFGYIPPEGFPEEKAGPMIPGTPPPAQPGADNPEASAAPDEPPLEPEDDTEL